MVLKGFQSLTGKQVYTLLLNIDWVPNMPNRLPETVELALHLVVSVPIGILYVSLTKRMTTPRRWMVGLLFGLLTAVTWFPLTAISDRVPAATDLAALLLWLLGHICYGLGLALICSLQSRGRIGNNIMVKR
ncbi:hypothetical protein I8J30_00995 [Paenibacillus sp. DLE-14]|uniref:Uncharacterized protein n=2 Tax=Paenibacillus lignilyticus TaxID=1172615 RepID=A0ABS5C5M2_9BACL|nr:DUF6789 family protein [Paenibacillus lignilyticus]MBP3961270.1 hypothetical protein [Paenibacillus lignilyticus]